MINRLRLLRNVGLFDSVSEGADLPLGRLTLIYAENGRGKTTLAAILRSLATGDPLPIKERRRISAQHPPHVVLDCDGGPPDAVFQGNAWNRVVANMALFDDVFIDENVSSGLVVNPEHRQRLHDIILGAQAVGLNQQLDQVVAEVREHNDTLRMKGEAIPADERGSLSVDAFCALPNRAAIDVAIQAAERNLAAAHKQDSVHSTQIFETLTLPGFDVRGLGTILQQDLPSLDAAAAAQVQAHLAELGPGGEAWVADGMQMVPQTASNSATTACPFCAQRLDGSPIIDHYRAHFSSAYADLKRTVSDALTALDQAHGEDASVAFERSVRVAGERQRFWSQFCDVPDIAIETAKIGLDWRAAREAVAGKLNEKQGAPLEQMDLPTSAEALVIAYEAHREAVAELSQRLQQTNATIRVVKEQAAAADLSALTADLAHLKSIKARHSTTTAPLCADYLAEKEAKAATGRRRDEVRALLEEHRETAFPAFETAINLYLQRFNAGFRLGSVTPANIRGGTTCTYNVLINDRPVPVAGGTPEPGEPSFRNTLSPGDRSTLALTFFFASLDQDSALANKVVVIDDPITSLDEHRTLTTVQEIQRLAGRAAQVIVLSHHKRFLCDIWRHADSTTRSALQVARDADGSTLREGDVNEDSITEHDRQHAMLRAYLVGSAGNNRDVAGAIRLVLEGFLHVAYPEDFPPGRMLGQFRTLCERRAGTARQILDETDTRELGEITEYANKFHHTTNPASETEVINDTELTGFVRRTLDFTKR